MGKLKMLGLRVQPANTQRVKVINTNSWIGSENSSKLYDHKWRKARDAFLCKNPLCAHCQEDSLVVPATEVDHKIPHRGDMTLFWDKTNWQGLCKPCHSRKTATENGGFGNGR